MTTATLLAGGHRIEYQHLRPVPGGITALTPPALAEATPSATTPVSTADTADTTNHRPTLVFLHEGLGSVSHWRDFPAQVAAATGCDALVYSRWGHGRSEPVKLPRPLTFMHDEARGALPDLLVQTGVSRAVLIGHSDGGSIALIHAAESAGHPAQLAGLVLLAPHVVAEDISVASIAQTRTSYRRTDLRQRLSRHHDDVDGAFYGWADTWLHADFPKTFDLTPLLPRITTPTLVIQGADDIYGTLWQVDAITNGVADPHGAERLVLPGCGHAPQRDRPRETLDAIASFVSRRSPSPAPVPAPGHPGPR